ncbi:MAG: hypothetical protein H0T79_06830 [Deltaproteobacteria bacterium]|nr:hypothetical protein [Deltaproteobacteria bacterium]
MSLVADPPCALCGDNLTNPIERSRRVCDDCAAKTGVVVLPPSQRDRLPCAKCRGSKFVRAIPRELGADRTAGPMFAAYQIPGTSQRIDPLDPRRGFGVLEAYICKGCGFVEWYCQDPLEIPIGPEYMTEDVDLSTTPFR